MRQLAMPLQRLDSIDGRGFLEIRSALRALRGVRPEANPDRVELLRDAAGAVAVFEEGESLIAVRTDKGTLLPSADARYLVANADPLRSRRSLRGANIPLIERAAIEFGKKLPFDFDEYVIAVVDDGPMRVVMLRDRDRDRREDEIGSAGRPSFEVGFDREKFEVVKAHFSR